MTHSKSKKKTKLLIIGAVPPPYHGVTLSTKHLIHSKLADIFQIIHLDISDHRDLENLGKFDLINISSALGQVINLAWLCFTKKPDIIYLVIAQNYGGFLRDGLFIMTARIFSGAKIIAHLRGGHFDKFYQNSPFLFKIFINLAMKCTHHPIVLGTNLKHMFSRWFKSESISMVPNGTDLFPVIERRVGQPQDGLVLAYLGNILRSKGVFDLLQSFRLVAEKHKQAKLYLAGAWKVQNGKFKSEVLEYIRENHLTERIEFLGLLHNEDKHDFLRKADIFVFPSYSEGHPNCVLEAMAAALPIIATSVGAIPETVLEGENGFLVQPGDWMKVKDKIDLLIRDPQLRIRMGTRSRQLVEQRFSREKNVDNMINVFKKAINNPHH